MLLILCWVFVVVASSLGHLKCPRIAIYGVTRVEDVNFVNRTLGSDMELYFFDTDANAPPKDPDVHVYISFAANSTHESRIFPRLASLSAFERTKWLHVRNNVSAIRLDNVYHCFFVSQVGHVKPSSMPVDDIPLISAAQYFPSHPLVSVFAAAYKSTKGNKITRVIESLHSQTYKNWDLC